MVFPANHVVDLKRGRYGAVAVPVHFCQGREGETKGSDHQLQETLSSQNITTEGDIFSIMTPAERFGTIKISHPAASI